MLKITCRTGKENMTTLAECSFDDDHQQQQPRVLIVLFSCEFVLESKSLSYRLFTYSITVSLK